eukprot:Hpha_TRINITY_DN16515_c1_g8::TRINITY_DN16515_c1_g8_i1::g.133865::m.133865/K04515/CAMK2; calcium/calmodulin-dependent protein kinase (CaM kinase) II
MSEPFEDKYDLEGELGSGSFSTVYRCVDKVTGGASAVKVIEKEKASKQQLGDAMKEVHILEVLGQHSNKCLCAMHEYFSTPTQLYIVLDLVAGPPLLQQITQRKHYSEKDAAHLTRNMLEAVGFMAEKRICHRDLKPENIVLAEVPGSDPLSETRVKIVDFGFADEANPDDPQLTMCCGSPMYIAPEILNCGLFKTGGPYGVECDMWSLGVICYILMCGYPPFRGASKNEVFKKIIRGTYSFPPQKVWGQVSDEAKDFVSGLLVLDPQERRSAKEAKKHPWVSHLEAPGDALAPPDRHLEEVVGNLREFNAAEKWRKGIFGIEAITRMRYAALCKKLCVRPNSDIEKILTEATSEINNVDLSKNYLGPKGLLALLPLVQQKPEIISLKFGNNGVNNTVVQELCRIIKTHPGVQSVDLSENAISHLAGRQILDAVSTNKRIVEFMLDNTMLAESAIRRIAEAVERNKLRAADPAAYRTPNASPERSSRRQRPSPLAADPSVERHSVTPRFPPGRAH